MAIRSISPEPKVVQQNIAVTPTLDTVVPLQEIEVANIIQEPIIAEVADIIQDPIIAVEVQDPSLADESVVVEENVNVEA